MSRDQLDTDAHQGYGFLLDPENVDDLVAMVNEHAEALDALETSSSAVNYVATGTAPVQQPPDNTQDAFTAIIDDTGMTYEPVGLRVRIEGTVDTTSQVIRSTAISGSAVSTKSAGANSWINKGVYGNAENGTENYSGYFANGTFYVQGISIWAAQMVNLGLIDARAGITVTTAPITVDANQGINFNGAKIVSGTNSPEGVVTANVGSLFLRTNGGAGTCLYVKESGSGNTGWVAK